MHKSTVLSSPFYREGLSQVTKCAMLGSGCSQHSLLTMLHVESPKASSRPHCPVAEAGAADAHLYPDPDMIPLARQPTSQIAWQKLANSACGQSLPRTARQPWFLRLGSTTCGSQPACRRPARASADSPDPQALGLGGRGT